MFRKVTPARAEDEQGAFLQGRERNWSIFYDGSRYFQISKEGAENADIGFYVFVDGITPCDENGVITGHQEGISVQDCLKIKAAVEAAYAALETQVVFSEDLECNGLTMPKTISNG